MISGTRAPQGTRRVIILAALWAATIIVTATITALISLGHARERGGFSLVWISDTQLYSQDDPEIFDAMTTWAIDHLDEENIRYVIHTGDVVQNSADPKQWDSAVAATSKLDGNIPLFIIPGDNDRSGDGETFGSFADYYGPGAFEARQAPDSVVTFFGPGEGRFDLFSAGGADFILAGLGFGVGQEGIDWLNGALVAHSGRTAILCFHDYLDRDGSLSPQGKNLYEQLVVPNPNVALVLCGHAHAQSYHAHHIDDGGDGDIDRFIHVVLSNYQELENGGNGHMRLLEFEPENGSLRIRTLSPVLERAHEELYLELAY